MTASFIEVSGIYKSFPVAHRHSPNRDSILNVLENITFDVERGSFHCLLGASGCGKSTLLRIIDGLIPSDRGEVRISGTLIQNPTPRLGMVFQQFNLLPWRTAQGNVEFGLEMLKISKAIRQEKAHLYLNQLGLQGFERYFPAQLSGGMQQRVALARALAIEPEILLMDEPFSALDALTRGDIQTEFLHLCHKQNLTVIFVTHDIDEAIFLADRIHIMAPHPGRIVASFDVSLPSERDEDIRNTPEFVMIRGKVATALKQATKPVLQFER